MLVRLGEGTWTPRVPGFDYIKFMEQDRERDNEEMLVMEIQAVASGSQG